MRIVRRHLQSIARLVLLAWLVNVIAMPLAAMAHADSPDWLAELCSGGVVARAHPVGSEGDGSSTAAAPGGHCALCAPHAALPVPSPLQGAAFVALRERIRPRLAHEPPPATPPLRPSGGPRAPPSAA